MRGPACAAQPSPALPSNTAAASPIQGPTFRWKGPLGIALRRQPATLTIRGGKVRQPVDDLPLYEELVRELRAVRPRHALPSAPVFPTTVTHPTRRKDFERAGIMLETEDGHADLHALRHNFGTRLADQGVPPAKLQKLMRHASIQMTMDYYVHLDVHALDEGLSLLSGTGG